MMYVIVVQCCDTQQLLCLAIPHYSARVHFSRTLANVGALRLIFVQSTCVITSMENANRTRLRAHEDQLMLNSKTYGQPSWSTSSRQQEPFCLAILRYTRLRV
jgi:hypothetical protein